MTVNLNLQYLTSNHYRVSWWTFKVNLIIKINFTTIYLSSTQTNSNNNKMKQSIWMKHHRTVLILKYMKTFKSISRNTFKIQKYILKWVIITYLISKISSRRITMKGYRILKDEISTSNHSNNCLSNKT